MHWENKEVEMEQQTTTTTKEKEEEEKSSPSNCLIHIWKETAFTWRYFVVSVDVK